ncbi:phosphatidylinositol N-acetylglucosaminyltransferase subunit A [Lepeophtheirus salmonis]|uniref:phosphatidylinositol N-acetylglucosaminyltransferase subunit A n=1 Tax=Lepeophtheirus salmonis TaxID=72036 RepID=UPI001AE59326|nr:phosphatidylinositol N-acetylglucosaminyltransferase subunit A-like [Lepeophtheirus salmonis]
MRLALVSDFFPPNIGGVETHIYQLAQRLLLHGHQVIIITHQYQQHVGVKQLRPRLKVYYLPFIPFYNQCILPTLTAATLPSLRSIFLEEGIELVHGHSAFSSLAHESLFVAGIMNIATVFTDHSLFGFADVSAVITNAFIKFSLANTNKCICVSHTGKVNTVLRAKIPQEDVYVIPNAVDAALFSPRTDKLIYKNKIVVAIGSRLVYRKGIDICARVIPLICAETFGEIQVHFLIAGDGPKRILLEEMIENHKLQDQVIMLGELPMEDVRNQLLLKADIFLNTSITEAFCMAILEACSCGLTVVSTNVGGIPEVLPREFIYLVEPSVSSVASGLIDAINDVISENRPSKEKCHKFVEGAYDWGDITKRTEVVYRAAVSNQKTFRGKVRTLWERGTISGPVMACVFLFCHYWILILNYLFPIQKGHFNA